LQQTPEEEVCRRVNYTLEENSSTDMADKKALNNRGLMEVNLGTTVQEISDLTGHLGP
jgi:hypothetical protein